MLVLNIPDFFHFMCEDDLLVVAYNLNHFASLIAQIMAFFQKNWIHIHNFLIESYKKLHLHSSFVCICFLFSFVFSNVGQINPFTLIYPQVHHRVNIPYILYEQYTYICILYIYNFSTYIKIHPYVIVEYL